MTFGDDALEDLGVPAGMFADREEQRLGALVGQRLEHGRRIARPRAVVEGQHDFVVLQEVVGLEVLEAEAGTAGGVDLDDAGNAERVRVVALGRGRSRRGGFCLSLVGLLGAGGLRPSSGAGDRHRNS